MRPFFSRRVYIRDDADLTMLCLAIIAPVAPGNEDFEAVYFELKRSHKTNQPRMRRAERNLLESWIGAFRNGHRQERRLPGESWKFGIISAGDDTHFVEAMFKLFSRQLGPAGRRIGHMDCAELSIECLGVSNSGPAPFSRAWANARAKERREMRRRWAIQNESYE
jgi:hypothetical protein